MFTNAGMNQFKDIFLNQKKAVSKRVADTQKCLRVSGKHNDLEEVGIDNYHHTMFEMLGNWSFGDYFKKDAIGWAWELLTEVYKLPKENLYITVFGGDKEDGVAADTEATEIWKNFIGEDRVLNFGKKDNFWEMGDSGPCGPCSEIHFDMRSDADKKKIQGKDLVNQGDPEVVEIWNLVFIQYNRKADRSLEKLPAAHVDTGMGFERLVRAVQKKKSNYDTDIFRPLINEIEKLTGLNYGEDEKVNIAMRVVADHIRAISFAICDGQLPSNTGAGYVIRRILRRAVRYSYSSLKMREPMIFKLVHVLAKQMSPPFDELKDQLQFVEKVIHEEETSFLHTLESGLKRIDLLMVEMKNSKSKTINGDYVFELYDTFGFPVDLTRLIARENGFELDEEGFSKAMELQKTRSRASAEISTDDWVIVKDDNQSEFVGYDHNEVPVHITRYRKITTKGKNQFQLVFDKTPFYAESGGQLGDTGLIVSNGEKISILDTKKENNLTIHLTEKLPTDCTIEFVASYNNQKRISTTNNHSATHLLHEALRNVLGNHVQQKGSLVNADYLRFDFSHFVKLTEDELKEIEKHVNEKIRENISLHERRSVPVKEAMAEGATALFGEKYGDQVRVIRFGTSVELCGGTHVPSTGQIGFFKIISESAVAAGVRRIEAITGEAAYQFVTDQLNKLNDINDLLKQKDTLKGIQTLMEENSSLRKEIEKYQAEEVTKIKNELIGKIEIINGIEFIAAVVKFDSSDAIKNLAYGLRNEVKNLFLLLASRSDDKATITIMISDDLVKSKSLDASKLIREWAKEIHGGGGGQNFYATAGGKNPEGINKVIEKAKDFVVSLK